jgi:predicted ATPase
LLPGNIFHYIFLSTHYPFRACFSPFILTASMAKTFEVALMAVSQKWSVLLYGPVGAGKTALINKLASGNRGIVLSSLQFTVVIKEINVS